jgi:hypothetical protein
LSVQTADRQRFHYIQSYLYKFRNFISETFQFLDKAAHWIVPRAIDVHSK